VVIALGPGFTAGRDAHALVETKRGITWDGYLAGGGPAQYRQPRRSDGLYRSKGLKAPADGIFKGLKASAIQ
jgi:xanthine dehydrogenase accessory factor